jgi:hypothetical protein
MEFMKYKEMLYRGVPDGVRSTCKDCDFFSKCHREHRKISYYPNDDMRCTTLDLTWSLVRQEIIKKGESTFIKGDKDTLQPDESIKTVFNAVEYIGIDAVCQCGELFAVSLLKIGSHGALIRCYGCDKHEAYIIEVPMKKYTMISLTQAQMGAFISIERIKTNDLEKAMENYPNISCIYDGWPMQQGEESEPEANKIYRY